MDEANTGSDGLHVQLVHEQIDYAALQRLVADPDTGAHGWFYGVTRRTTVKQLGDAKDSKAAPQVLKTETLFYETHAEMAIHQLSGLAKSAREQFGLTKVVIVHRIGEVPIGEASVVVGCSSAHRRDTFAAIPWIMDQLKSDVAIWKQERFVDGSTEWVHPVSP